MGNSCFCLLNVDQQDRALVENWGKFSHTLDAGLKFIVWPVQSIAGKISIQIQQLDLKVETKTKDNVFVEVAVSVQYKVFENKIREAFYELSNPRQQIEAYVYDVVRSEVPTLDLDDAFVSKDQVSRNVAVRLREVMGQYGFQIMSALVTDIEPDRRVKDAMNEINASKQYIAASRNKAEGDKILMVKAAEADAQSKYLSGCGVARQRAAIVEGLRDSIHDFSETVGDTTPHDVMELLLLTQYFDMLKDVGVHNTSSAVFLPKSTDSTVRDGFLQATK